MRFNSCELKQLATDSSTECTKEGVLCLKEKEGKLWNKTDVITERWCRLVGNLLFYMKGKSNTSEPIGVLVLEQFSVKPEESNSFVIEFEGGDRSTYFLANSATEAADWIKVLRCSSYAYLKERYYQLKKQADVLSSQTV